MNKRIILYIGSRPNTDAVNITCTDGATVGQESAIYDTHKQTTLFREREVIHLYLKT
jgi:hypothetical protein